MYPEGNKGVTKIRAICAMSKVTLLHCLTLMVFCARSLVVYDVQKLIRGNVLFE